MKCAISILLLFIVRTATAQDTFNVYFPLNNAAIDKQGEQRIDDLVFKDKLIHGQKLIVLGYSDYVGDDKYNDALSLSRAQHVRDYLGVMGFDKNDIKLCTGKGKIQRNMSGKDGNAPDRKVQIIIDRTAVVPPPSPAIAKPVVKTRFDAAQLKVDQAITLSNINFMAGSPIILPTSYPALEELLTFMRTNASVRIQVEGHVCCPGLPDDDNDLSYRRAVAVGHYLVEKGIENTRLKYIGYGSTRMLVKDERTEDDRVRNRRVEIRILSK